MSDTNCTTQNTITPAVTTVEGNPIPTRMQCAYVQQGQAATIRWVMRNSNGDPINLSGCAAGVTAKGRILEAVLSANGLVADIAGTIEAGTAGVVSFVLTANAVANPGIFYFHVGIFNSAGSLLFASKHFMVVEKGPWVADDVNYGGPPSLNELRLALRDSGPEDNTLLNVIEFDSAEVALALMRPIQYWNEAPPLIGIAFDSSQFGWRYYWMEGAVAQLLMLAAENYRRNHLQYSASGLTVDDKNKFNDYDKRGSERWAGYREWVHFIKVSANMEAGFGELGSGYGRAALNDGTALPSGG